DPKTGDIVATVELEDTAPEGAAADGKGHIFVNNERKNTIQVIDVKTWKATASWPLAPSERPTGLAYDKHSSRLYSGCKKPSLLARGPAPAPRAGAEPPQKGGRGRGPQGPIVAAWFIAIKQ